MPRKKDLIPLPEDEHQPEKEKKHKKVKEQEPSKVDLILNRLKELKNEKKKEPEIIEESESDSDDEVDFIIQPKQKVTKKVERYDWYQGDDDEPEPEPEPKPKKPRKPRQSKQPEYYYPQTSLPPPPNHIIDTLQKENERLKAQVKYNGLSRLQSQSSFMKIKF